MILNKFNSIIPTSDISSKSIINTYLENYFESDIHMYHPEYINQILWHNKIDKDSINKIIKSLFDNFIIQKKQFIKQLIKKDDFELYILNSIISKFINKQNYILKLFNSDIDFKCIINILSEPLLINYLKNEFTNLNVDVIDEIKKLYYYILDEYNYKQNENVIWFIKLISNALLNNFLFNISNIINISNKYILLYKINNGFDYINEIKIKYKFINNQILLKLINEEIQGKILEYIDICDLFELYFLVDYKMKSIINIFSNNMTELLDKIVLNLNRYYSLSNIKIIIDIIHILSLHNFVLSNIIKIIDNKDSINSLIDIIHNNINNKKYVVSIIKVLNLIKNKDVFFDKYHKLLILRILSNNINIENEFYILKIIQFIFGIKISDKIHKVINDYYISEKNFNYYKTIKNKLVDFNIITTSYNNWDINYNQGYVQDIQINNLPFNNLLESYSSYYKKIYDYKRDLLWLLHYGEVEIEYKNQIIIMLPIQLLILELIDQNTKITYTDIIECSYFVNYSNKFKNKIVNSLIKGKILINNNNYLQLSNKNVNSNLVEVYSSLGYENIFVNTDKELSFTREEILKSVINHLLKEKPLNNKVLYNLSSNMIKLFNVDTILFDKVIIKMINQDYIINVDDQYIKCLY